MRNEKNVLPVLVGFLALLVAGVVFFAVLRGGFHPTLSSTISSDQLLAEVDKPTTGNGLPVKVLEGRKYPFVTPTRLDSNETVKAYATCAAKPPAPTAPQVACWEARQLATITEERRSDAATSIQEIDKMLTALKGLDTQTFTTI